MRTFTVVLDPDEDEGGYVALVPALPGCITQGDTVDEALINVREAIQVYIESLAADDEPIPTDVIGESLVSLDTPPERFVEQVHGANGRSGATEHSPRQLVVVGI